MHCLAEAQARPMTIGQYSHGRVPAMTNCRNLTLLGKITWPAGTGQLWHTAGHDESALTVCVNVLDGRYKAPSPSHPHFVTPPLRCPLRSPATTAGGNTPWHCRTGAT